MSQPPRHVRMPFAFAHDLFLPSNGMNRADARALYQVSTAYKLVAVSHRPCFHSLSRLHMINFFAFHFL
jgi:hypothetical protein